MPKPIKQEKQIKLGMRLLQEKLRNVYFTFISFSRCISII